MNLNISKLLLVDDERNILNLLEEVLRKEGFRNILKTTSGEQAVELCRYEKPDAIILDIMLPGMDGIETCRRIRAFSYCPILFLSVTNILVNALTHNPPETAVCVSLRDGDTLKLSIR